MAAMFHICRENPMAPRACTAHSETKSPDATSLSTAVPAAAARAPACLTPATISVTYIPEMLTTKNYDARLMCCELCCPLMPTVNSAVPLCLPAPSASRALALQLSRARFRMTAGHSMRSEMKIKAGCKPCIKTKSRF